MISFLANAVLHVVGVAVVFGGGYYAGVKYGAGEVTKLLAEVKADIATFESKAAADVKVAETWVLAEIAKIKAKLYLVRFIPVTPVVHIPITGAPDV